MRAPFAILAFLLSTHALACEPGTWGQPFKPALKGTHQRGSNVPMPSVEVANITRGSGSDGMSCDDAGILGLLIRMPPSAPYGIGEYGVYFRVVSGELPDQIFPQVPMIGPVVDGAMKLSFAWFDGAPPHRPLNIRVEAFLVSNDLEIGPSTVFEVRE